MKLKNKRFSFEEVLIKALYEANAVGVDESQLINEFASCCGNMAHRNRTVFIAALLGDHKLNGFKEILNLRSKTERIEKIIEGRLWLSSGEKCQLQQTQEKIYPWIYIVGRKSFVFYVEGVYSVWNNHDELLLKNVFCTILLKLQFLTCHKFAVFLDSYQLSELPFQWFDPIK